MTEMSHDEPRVDLCSCDGFSLWYDDDGVLVCACGHPAEEHLDQRGSCTGKVELR